MEFLASLDTYEQDQPVKTLWERYADELTSIDGICYYKHPIIISSTRSVPDLALLAKGYEPLAIKCLPYRIDEIARLGRTIWMVAGREIDSPLYELEDFIIGLQHKFDRERFLRRRLTAVGVIAFPLISKTEFESKFPEVAIPEHIKTIWSDFNIEDTLVSSHPLEEKEWLLAKSVFQGISPLKTTFLEVPTQSASLGGAINILEKEIALLDEEQHKVAIQMAPGPQRIRGLAGTGKTVVLAMKAANIHLRYPEKRILFTFHTQSLYNQTKSLITKFYRVYSDSDPDWDQLHVRHGWGSQARPGVYYDLCKRLGVRPLALQSARTLDSELPFRACCNDVLRSGIQSFYDFIIVDEAQDFPQEYFQILAKLATPEKRIYWAYDELQSLSSVEVPGAEELFGNDTEGKPQISLQGDDYPGGIEKDFVLHRSYRSPLPVLMLAHGIGLGIHGPRGCVQMLGNKTSWTSTGYQVEQGNLNNGEETVIFRPPENSPNKIKHVYTGEQSNVLVKVFENRNDELEWISVKIADDINNQGVKPDQIVVISLDARVAKRVLIQLQEMLHKKSIISTIPGLVDRSWEFAEPGLVTLSTVYRAKGNEAPIVYILGFESLYNYAEEIESRNIAFTSISRSKGWVRISGIGKQMTEIKREIDQILADIPRFKFIFPDMDKMRKLDASETSRRRKEVNRAKKLMNEFLEIDKEAFGDVNLDLKKKVKQMWDEIDYEGE